MVKYGKIIENYCWLAGKYSDIIINYKDIHAVKHVLLFCLGWLRWPCLVAKGLESATFDYCGRAAKNALVFWFDRTSWMQLIDSFRTRIHNTAEGKGHTDHTLHSLARRGEQYHFRYPQHQQGQQIKCVRGPKEEFQTNMLNIYMLNWWFKHSANLDQAIDDRHLIDSS